MSKGERLSPDLVAIRSGSNTFHVATPSRDGTMCGKKGPLLPAAEAGRVCPKCKREWLAMARAVNGVLANRPSAETKEES